MGVKVTGVAPIKVNLANMAKRASKGAREAMKRGAVKITERSKEYAPRLHNPDVKSSGSEEGFLEKAIEYEPIQTSSAGRIGYEVFVDEDAEAFGDKTVGDYATIMHETDYNPGDKSRAKGGDVGSKYMERAYLELEDEIKQDVEANAARGIGH